VLSQIQSTKEHRKYNCHSTRHCTQKERLTMTPSNPIVFSAKKKSETFFSIDLQKHANQLKKNLKENANRQA
jgi:hypothetical protein